MEIHFSYTFKIFQPFQIFRHFFFIKLTIQEILILRISFICNLIRKNLPLSILRIFGGVAQLSIHPKLFLLKIPEDDASHHFLRILVLSFWKKERTKEKALGDNRFAIISPRFLYFS